MSQRTDTDNNEGCGFAVVCGLFSPFAFYYNGFVAYTVYNWLLPRCPAISHLEFVGGLVAISFASSLLTNYNKHYPDGNTDWSRAWTCYVAKVWVFPSMILFAAWVIMKIWGPK